MLGALCLTVDALLAFAAELRTTASSAPIVKVITTKKRVSRKAVERNRARRRLVSAARAVLPFMASPLHVYMLVATRQALTQPFEALCKDVRSGAVLAGAGASKRTRLPGGEEWEHWRRRHIHHHGHHRVCVSLCGDCGTMPTAPRA